MKKHYHVSYHFTKDGKNGFGHSLVTLPKRLRTYDEFENLRYLIKENEKVDEVVILGWNKLKG